MRALLVAQALLLSLVVSAMFADVPSRAEEPDDRSVKFTLQREGEEPQEVWDLRELFPPPAPGVKMVVHNFNIDDGDSSPADTSQRTYSLASRDRYVEMLNAPPVEFEFDLNSEPPKEKFSVRLRNQFLQGWQALNRAVRPQPAGSAAIGDKIVDAFWQAADADQIQGFSVEMEIEHGRVILSGDVASLEQKKRVTTIVKGVPEVQRLVNRLTVREVAVKE